MKGLLPPVLLKMHSAQTGTSLQLQLQAAAAAAALPHSSYPLALFSIQEIISCKHDTLACKQAVHASTLPHACKHTSMMMSVLHMPAALTSPRAPATLPATTSTPPRPRLARLQGNGFEWCQHHGIRQ